GGIADGAVPVTAIASDDVTERRPVGVARGRPGTARRRRDSEKGGCCPAVEIVSGSRKGPRAGGLPYRETLVRDGNASNPGNASRVPADGIADGAASGPAVTSGHGAKRDPIIGRICRPGATYRCHDAEKGGYRASVEIVFGSRQDPGAGGLHHGEGLVGERDVADARGAGRIGGHGVADGSTRRGSVTPGYGAKCDPVVGRFRGPRTAALRRDAEGRTRGATA